MLYVVMNSCTPSWIGGSLRYPGVSSARSQAKLSMVGAGVDGLMDGMEDGMEDGLLLGRSTYKVSMNDFGYRGSRY